MNGTFEYVRADDVAAAVALVSGDSEAQYLAGGTTQIDLILKDKVLNPERLVDITRLPLRGITLRGDALVVGALTTSVNGAAYELRVASHETLLDALRDRLGLTGTKKGCDQGACGACTVLVDGKRVLSCLTLAVQCDGREVTTIEGLAADGRLHPVQEAFIRHDGFQCGYCTPGQIMSAVALLAEGRAGSDEEIREFMSGNICRCGAYPNIVAAIREAAGQ